VTFSSEAINALIEQAATSVGDPEAKAAEEKLPAEAH